MVTTYIDHWDITRGHFNHCDRDPKGKRGIHIASAGKIVVITPFRVRQWRGENYQCEMFGLQNMSRCFCPFSLAFDTNSF
jgi:hypothetical protein